MAPLAAAGGAILLLGLVGCGRGATGGGETNDEALISRRVDSMMVIASDNGKPVNLLIAPLMEDHAYAKAAFEEFRQGIEFVGYNDSTGLEASRVVADYALHWTARDMWELRGNVVVTGEEGQRLYTQQLYWDRKIHKIYSNVDSKVEEGPDVFIGEGFEAEDDFSRWTFRRLTGRVSVDTAPGAGAEPPPVDAINDSLQ